MMLPFSHDQFLSVFHDYNTAIWPVQLAIYVLGFAALALIPHPKPWKGRVIVATIAVMWLWTGIAYHGLFFSRINALATLFGALFAFQGMLLLAMSIKDRPLQFRLRHGSVESAGLIFCVYALLLYPLVGYLAGQTWPAMPVFGVSPCPVVIFTFGLFMLADTRPPILSLVVPGLWSLVGGSAAFLLGVPQDWMLLFSAAIAIPLIFWSKPKLLTHRRVR